MTHSLHDCSSHRSANFIVALKCRRDVDSERVGPWNFHVLSPPTGHHRADEKPEMERHRNDVFVLVEECDD